MYDYTGAYLRRDGRPWLPVMGEFHFSRYRPEFWEEELRKIQAGGISIVSSYVFWIHHEEVRGQCDFSGCRDLRRFLQAAQTVGLQVFLRIGPWVHGETRNGGFPDWLQELDGTVRLRSNDPAYLDYVRSYWTQMAAQCSGMMDKDGGPVIGIQIENEYGHVGGLRGEEGEAHMRTLTALAKELGLDTPFYTATGWGGAATGGLLPVSGGYCEAPWDPSTGELPASPNYVFSHAHDDSLIVGDRSKEAEADAPFLTAELGGGLQVTRHRRPVACGKDIAAMAMVKLGSGAALLGCYMFHGGSNPEGRLSTLQESRASGGYCDLPEINYDFNAPIRQYGTMSDTYRELRMLALFAQDFGEDLARLPAEIDPVGVDPEDTHTLRTAWRHDGEHGYVFVNNYQRRRNMDAHSGVILRGRRDAPVEFPSVDVRPGEFFFFPYGLTLGGAVLTSALATPLCRLDGETGSTWVFYGDREPCFCWKDGISAPVLHLSREQALSASKVRLDRGYLILSDNFVWVQNGELAVTGGKNTVIKAYPALKKAPASFAKIGTDGPFSVYERRLEIPPVTASLALQSAGEERAIYQIDLHYPQGSISGHADCDWLLEVDYAGESMEIYCGGKKINDYFYTGQPALLSLRYFDFPSSLTAVVRPLRDTSQIFLESWPEIRDGRACRINTISVEGQFRT